MRIRKSVRIWGAIVGLLAIGMAAAYCLWPRTRLNVILVTLDTTRADRIGCYGYPRARTPALDALAERGILFEAARTPIPVTLPAHASMLTGLYPPEHGLHSNSRARLGAKVPCLTEILRDAGYDTGAFVGSFVLNSKFGLNRGFQTYDDDLSSSESSNPLADRRRSGRVVVDSALAWLQSPRERPFFCWVHLYDPHFPYEARQETFGEEFVERPYDAGIAFADRQVQRLRDFLRDKQLEETTLVIVAGDHGESLMEHNEPEHGFLLYDSTLRVPFILSGPKFFKSGARVSTPVSLADLMPTVLDCLELPLRTPTSGQSLKQALIGQSIASRPLYAETDIPFLDNRWAPLHAVVSGNWKYIETTRAELYDLSKDAAESQNLVESESSQASEMRRLLHEIWGKMKPRDANSVSLSAEERRIMESL